jgi:hypothetical protein
LQKWHCQGCCGASSSLAVTSGGSRAGRSGGGGNPDASLSRVFPGSGAVAGRGRGVHVGWFGSVVLPL